MSNNPTHQIWTTSPIQRIPSALRNRLKFYSPLEYSLDYLGTGEATFTRGGASTAIYRDGASHVVSPNVPRFEYAGETAQGVILGAGETLGYPSGTRLQGGGTLLWLEDAALHVAPWGEENPFSSNNEWSGTLGVHLRHIVKAEDELSDAEINFIIKTLTGTSPGFSSDRSFLIERPVVISPTTYELTAAPDLTTLIVNVGGITLYRVASAPNVTQFAITGKTLTLGTTLSPVPPIRVFYRPVGVTPAPTFVIEDLAGTKDGANKTFTISSTPTGGVILVFRQGIAIGQVPSSAGLMEYTISGTTITMGTAPAAGDDLWALFIGTGSGFIMENLIGTKDGANKAFTITDAPTGNIIEVVRQGIQLFRRPSLVAIQDYTQVGTAITLQTAPQATDALYAFYRS